MDRWDYIIVGAGSAGCVLTERLSADGKASVLVLEAGGDDANPLIHMPKGMAKLVMDPKHTWYFPVGQPRVEGEAPSEIWVRGLGLGGRGGAAARWKATAMAEMLGIRCEGSLASARSITSSTSALNRGLSAPGRGGAARKCCCISPRASSASNGRTPVSA